MKKEINGRMLRRKATALLVMLAMIVSILETSTLTLTAFAEETKNKTTTLLQDPKDKKYATGLDENYYQYIEEIAEQQESSTVYSTRSSSTNLPDSVDNSTGANGKYFPPIGDQKAVGSCLSWSRHYYLNTYLFNRYYDREVDETNIFSPKWGYVNGNLNKGSVTLERCPNTNFSLSYHTGDDFPADCEADWMQTELGTSDEIVYVLHGKNQDLELLNIDGPDSEDLVKVKQSLANGNILGFDTYSYWFNYKTLDMNLCEENRKYAGEHIVVACAGEKGSNPGGHAMTIVGYNDNIGVDLNENGILEVGEMGAFKLANSWGDTWKNNGFVWLSYDALNATSKYSAIGTGENEARQSIAGYICEKVIDPDRMGKEEVDYYAVVTVNTCNKRISFGKNREGKIFYRPDYGLGYGIGTSSTVNYAGTTGYADAVLVTEMESDMSELDIQNYSDSFATIKDVKFVDNVNGYTYLGKADTNIIDAKKTVTWNVDRENTAPYFSKYTLNEVDGQVSVDVNAKNKGLAMKYQLEYVSEAGGDSGSLVANTSGKFTFNAKENAYYRIKVTATDANNVSTSKTKLIKVKNVLSADDIHFTIDKTSPASIAESANLKVAVDTESKNYEYCFGTLFNGKEINFGNGYSAANTCMVHWGNILGICNAEAIGKHTLFVDVKNTVTGVIIRKTIDDFEVEGLSITSFTADKVSPQKAGTAIKLSVEVENEATYRYNTYKFTAIKDGVETNLAPYIPVDYNVTWTPTEPGDYILKYYIRDNYGQEATATMQYRIEEKSQSVVYYTTSWSQAYIHYKTGDGTWTTVPGEQMTASTEQSGYQWKYEIDLGDADSATVCFNNGSGNWDSNNGSNYVVKAGIYGIKNGAVNQLTAVATPTPTSKPTATPTNKPTATPTNKPTAIPTATPTPANVFEITSINASVPSPQKVGATITLDCTVNNVGYPHPHGGYTYNFSITKDGVETANLTSFGGSGITADWTPTEPGTYVITATTASQYGIATATKTMEYVITGDNTTTVYYNNSSWNQAYIHYQIEDGTWTTVPGEKMEDDTTVSGYKWKYVIDLGDEDNTTVCFNNGSGSWDSNNSKNYNLKAGVYGIKNSSVETLQLGMKADVTLDRASTASKGDITANVTVSNGVAPYTYYYTYSYNGNKQVSDVSSTENSYTFSAYYTGTYGVIVKVVDAEGTEVTATKTTEVGEFAIKDITASQTAPVKTGTTITFTATVENEMLYKGSTNARQWSVKNTETGVEKQYSQYQYNKLVWTPEAEGNYEITCTSKDTNGETATKTITYTVKDSNTATIYYNTGWKNAYAHYCVEGGSWTTVPGKVMTATSEKSGYTHKLVIDLGDADRVTVCFNNGSGSWDSNNGANYTISAGSYGVSSGSISEVK